MSTVDFSTRCGEPHLAVLHAVTFHPLLDVLEHRPNLTNSLQATRLSSSALLDPDEKVGVGLGKIDLHVEAF